MSVRQWTENLRLPVIGPFAIGVLAYIVLFGGLVLRRLSASTPVWNTDFGIFYQSGRLILGGEFGEVYRFIPSGVTPAEYPGIWQEFLTHVDGYFYAQSPWHPFLMAPFAAIDLEPAFAIYAFLMVCCPLVAAVAIRRNTTHGTASALAVLFAPVAVPFATPETWGGYDFAWHWILTGGPLRWESPLGATIWWGQYTPAILALLTLAFVAAHNRRHAVAGLLLVLAAMKPNVLFAVPLVLLVTDEWLPLIRHTVAWAIVFNLVFMAVPGLGYPFVFMDNVFGYTEVFWPIFLQAHNYVWMAGIVVVTIALWHDGSNDMQITLRERIQVVIE